MADFDTVPSHAPTWTEEEKSFWERKVDDFKEKARQFYAALQALLSLEAEPALKSDPQLKAEWDTLAQRGFSIRDKVQSLTSKIDSAVNWFRSTFSGYDIDPQEELGAFPLIALVPIAAIAAAAALMTKYISDVYIFQKKLEEVRRLTAQGMDPAQAAALVKATDAPPLFGNLGTLVKWAGIGFAAWFVYKEFLKKGRF